MQAVPHPQTACTQASFHHCAIKWSWSSSNSSITNESPEEKGESTEDPAACDESDFDNIKDHAGWVVKRVRETLMEIIKYR